MTHDPQLPPNSHVLSKYHVSIRPTPFKKLAKPFKPQYLKLTGKPKEHTCQQEQPRSVNTIN